MDALRTLGPAAAAALAAVIKSYQDRLGRPPSPAELDGALQEKASEPRSEPAAPPIGLPEADLARRRNRRENEDACERQLAMETAVCNQVTENLGRAAGRICHASASERYAECLEYGIGREQTPLTIVPYYPE